jgi:hypothetical protein
VCLSAWAAGQEKKVSPEKHSRLDAIQYMGIRGSMRDNIQPAQAVREKGLQPGHSFRLLSRINM